MFSYIVFVFSYDNFVISSIKSIFFLLKKSIKISSIKSIKVERSSLWHFILFFWLAGSSLLHRGFLQLPRVGATLCCRARASHCGGSSLRSTGSRRRLQWVQHAGSGVVACGLWSTGSVIVTLGLSCSTACRIFPDQKSTCSLHQQEDSHLLCHQGALTLAFLIKVVFIRDSLEKSIS